MPIYKAAVTLEGQKRPHTAAQARFKLTLDII